MPTELTNEQREMPRAVNNGTELRANPRQRLGYYYTLGGGRVPESDVRAMCDGGFLACGSETMLPGRGEYWTAVYVITDAGRAALKAADG